MRRLALAIVLLSGCGTVGQQVSTTDTGTTSTTRTTTTRCVAGDAEAHATCQVRISAACATLDPIAHPCPTGVTIQEVPMTR